MQLQLQPQVWDFNLCLTATYLILSLFISFTFALPSASLESMEMDASSADDGRIRTGNQVPGYHLNLLV